MTSHGGDEEWFSYLQMPLALALIDNWGANIGLLWKVGTTTQMTMCKMLAEVVIDFNKFKGYAEVINVKVAMMMIM